MSYALVGFGDVPSRCNLLAVQFVGTFGVVNGGGVTTPGVYGSWANAANACIEQAGIPVRARGLLGAICKYGWMIVPDEVLHILDPSLAAIIEQPVMTFSATQAANYRKKLKDAGALLNVVQRQQLADCLADWFMGHQYGFGSTTKIETSPYVLQTAMTVTGLPPLLNASRVVFDSRQLLRFLIGRLINQGQPLPTGKFALPAAAAQLKTQKELVQQQVLAAGARLAAKMPAPPDILSKGARFTMPRRAIPPR